MLISDLIFDSGKPKITVDVVTRSSRSGITPEMEREELKLSNSDGDLNYLLKSYRVYEYMILWDSLFKEKIVVMSSQMVKFVNEFSIHSWYIAVPKTSKYYVGDVQKWLHNMDLGRSTLCYTIYRLKENKVEHRKILRPGSLSEVGNTRSITCVNKYEDFPYQVTGNFRELSRFGITFSYLKLSHYESPSIQVVAQRSDESRVNIYLQGEVNSTIHVPKDLANIVFVTLCEYWRLK